MDDIDLLLEADLDAVSYVDSDEEQDPIQAILLLRKQQATAIDSEIFEDIDFDALKIQSDRLFTAAASDIIELPISDEHNHDNITAKLCKTNSSNEERIFSQQVVFGQAAGDNEEESDVLISERRRVVETVMQLMIGSIEALAEIFTREDNNAFHFHTREVVLPIDECLTLVVPQLFDEVATLAQTAIQQPAISTVDMQSATMAIDRLKDTEKQQKVRNQLEDNEDELLVKLMVDADQAKLEADRKKRQDRAKKREDAAKKAKLEGCVIRIQRVYRGSMARKVFRIAIQAAHVEHLEAIAALELAMRTQEVQAMTEEEEHSLLFYHYELLSMQVADIGCQAVIDNCLAACLYEIATETIAIAVTEKKKEEEAIAAAAAAAAAALRQAEADHSASVVAGLNNNFPAPSADQGEDNARVERNTFASLLNSTASNVSVQPLPAHAHAVTPPQAAATSVPVAVGAAEKSSNKPSSSARKETKKPVQQSDWGGVMSTASWNAEPSAHVAQPIVSSTCDRHNESIAVIEEDAVEEEEEEDYGYVVDDSDYEDWLVEAEAQYQLEQNPHLHRHPVGESDKHSSYKSAVKEEEVLDWSKEMAKVDARALAVDAPYWQQLYQQNQHLCYSSNIVFDIDESIDCNVCEIINSKEGRRQDSVQIAEHPLLAACRQWRQSYASSLNPTSNGKTNSPAVAAEASANEIDYSVEELTDVDYILQKYGNQLTKLTLNVNKISSLQGIQCLSRLHFLSIADNQLHNVSELSALQQLSYLNVDSNRISDLTALHNHQAIQFISANCNNLQHFPSIVCPQLLKLDLYKNMIQDFGCSSSASSASDRIVNVSAPTAFNKLLLGATALPAGFVSPSWHFPRLLYLNLGRNNLHDIDGQSLSSSCIFLQTLILSQNKLQQVPSPLHLACLSSLWLNGNQLQSLDPWQSSTRRNSELEPYSRGCVYPLFLPQLQKLYLQDNQLASVRGDCLQMMPMLTELDLSFNQISSLQDVQEGFISSDSPSSTSMQYLSNLKINDNPVSSQTRVYNRFSGPQHPRAFATMQSEEAIRRARVQHAIEEQDWKSFFSLTLPALRLLSNVELPALLPAQQHGISINHGRSQKQPSDKHRDEMLQLLLHMKAEMELTLHKHKKKLFKAKKEESKGVVDHLPMHKEEVQLQLSEMHCQRLCNLLDRSADSTMLQANSMVLTFFEGSELLPAQLTQNKHKSESVLKAAATRIQSSYRGYAVRKKLRQLMHDIRYEDNELDDILNAVDDDLFQVDDLDIDDEELFNYRDTGRQSLPAAPLVYGDHIRLRSRRNNSSREGMNSSEQQQQSGGDSNSGRCLAGQDSDMAAAATSRLSSQTQPDSARSQASRPQSSASAFSAVTEQSAGLYQEGEEGEDEEEEASRQSARSSIKHGKRQQLQEEWGITDPKVLAALMKRNKRMKSFQTAAAQREKEKDSQVRYQRFVRASHTGMQNAPHAGRTKRTAANSKQQSAPPAWLYNPDNPH